MQHPLSAVDLVPPEGWHDTSVISFVAPAETGMRANLLVTQERTKDPDAAAFAVRQNAELSVALPRYARHQVATTTVSGREGVRVEYSFVNSAGEVVRQNVVYVVRDGIAYTLVMTCEEQAHDKVRALFDWVLASYKLI